MSKKIVIDARMYNESGIGRYIRNLITHLQVIDKENAYFILLLKQDFEKLEFSYNFYKVLADFRWYSAGEQIKLPKVLEKLDPDLVHFPHFNVPLLYDGKFIVTIHDLIHQHFQMRRATTLNPLFYKLKQLGYKKVFKNAIYKSQKILVPSNFVKGQLMNDWKVNNEKAVVTYEAVDEHLLEIVNKIQTADITKTMKDFNIKKPYLFYVGNAHPHKNVEGLIGAFRLLKVKYPELSLVLSGNDHYFWQRLKRENSDEGIVYTGFISEEQLVALYRQASVFVLPSSEEGFGIPVLEAFASSCPVVSSNKGSLPEVGGDAALYFDPVNTDEIMQQISKVIEDSKLSNILKQKGLKRYKDFCWKTLAQKTLEVYLQCA